MLPIHRTPKTVFNYDDIPAGYYHEAMLQGRPTQRFWHREKFREVASRIRDGERVLDLGCGPGSFLHVLTEEKPQIEAIGADIASRQINYAKNFFQASQPQARVSFQALDLATEQGRLPFEDASFDVITSIEVVEHIHPHLAAQMLMEARRVLKPQGRLLITTPNYRSFWPLIELLLEKLSPVKYHDQHINKFTPNAFVKFLEICGYEVLGLDTIFVVAPFLASLSPWAAKKFYAFERNALPRIGSLLMAEARPLE
ncbi:class I SAM-dependent methyltransferase [Bdellovibrionota bacterium FG-1]